MIPGICKARYGWFPVNFFKLLTCSMCYKYLFREGAELGPAGKGDSLAPLPGSSLSPDLIMEADVTNQTVRDFVCSTLSGANCIKWKDCCYNAISCCDEQQVMPDLNYTAGPYCNRTWDGFGCFPDALPGDRLYINCPSYIEHALPFAQGHKDCMENGTWFVDQESTFEWTNYSACVQTQDFHKVVYLGLACNVASILLLVPACAIFLFIRQLRSQKRIKLHLNLFLSFIVTSVVTIMWDFLVYVNRLDNSAETAMMYKNTGGCKFLYIMSRYVRTANFFWMFCEGFYLHRLIVHAFSVPKTLIPYYVFGWGFAWIPALVYSIIRATNPDFDKRCWVPNIGDYEWIMYTPNLFCIAANLVFICNILRILCSKLQAHPNEPSNYRRGLKATFVLIPLFGLQQFLVIYRPQLGTAPAFAYEICSTIINNTQGAAVALIFCFFNGEVHTYLKGFVQSKRHAGSRTDYTRKGSTSSTTQFTTLPAGQRRGTKTYDASTPGYIPLSTSSTANDGLSEAPPGNGHIANSNA